MKNLSDDRLLTLFEQGVNEAFDELLNRYKEKLYTYIYVLVQNREMAEDIFQDTFTRVIVTIKQKRYNEKGRFQGFLYARSRMHSSSTPQKQGMTSSTTGNSVRHRSRKKSPDSRPLKMFADLSGTYPKASAKSS